MTYQKFNSFCRGPPASSYVMQWGGSHVWKVGGKVFAIGGWADGAPGFTFKVSAVGFEILKDQPGLRPAPYLASRGLTWIQHVGRGVPNDAALRDYIRDSNAIVSAGLTGRTRRELGLA